MFIKADVWRPAKIFDTPPHTCSQPLNRSTAREMAKACNNRSRNYKKTIQIIYKNMLWRFATGSTEVFRPTSVALTSWRSTVKVAFDQPGTGNIFVKIGTYGLRTNVGYELWFTRYGRFTLVYDSVKIARGQRSLRILKHY